MLHQTGTETGRPEVVVSGVPFLYYSLGGGLYVWRTPDQSIEVGRRGGGGTFYCKIKGHILEATFLTMQSAARAGAKTLQPYVDPRAG